eukprot:COSAG02_NODE_919_length_15936_cov_5.055314_16_plen_47_part_00
MLPVMEILHTAPCVYGLCTGIVIRIGILPYRSTTGRIPSRKFLPVN